MERKLRLQKSTDVIGVLYDGTNNVKARGDFSIINDSNGRLKLEHKDSGKKYEVPKSAFDMGERTPRRIPEKKSEEEVKQEQEKEQERKKKVQEKRKKEEQEQDQERKENNLFPMPTLPAKLSEAADIIRLIDADIKNIWMVGPAGCGKTTICGIAAKELKKPFYVLSCGRGTSASDIRGYHYPTPKETDFSRYFRKPSIIVLDEFTALEDTVAQLLNAALANGMMTTTTGKVYRHHECVIVATSNTFGTGADTMYVANQQLDASTIDRFAGGIVQIDYSKSYESRFDKHVVKYANQVRRSINENQLQRILSTRSIINATKLKNKGFYDWKDRLIVNWSAEEREILNQDLLKFEKEEKNNKIQATKKSLIKEVISHKKNG